MGCFNEGCSISGTPILYKEEAYLVVLNDIYSARAAETLQLDTRKIEFVLAGIYDNYGAFNPYTRSTKADEKKFEVLYNDRDISERLHFWVSKEAWDWAQIRYADLEIYTDWLYDTSHRFSIPKPWWHDEVARIFAAHRELWRNPLSGFMCSFQSHSPKDEFSAASEAFGITKTRYQRMIDERNDAED